MEKLSDLKSKIDVVFDKSGVPPIEVVNEQDAYLIILEYSK